MRTIINGVGSKTTRTNSFIETQEGQFRNDQLHGFGRRIKWYKNGHEALDMGFFENGLLHGWG